MAYIPVHTGQFKKDVKRMLVRGKNGTALGRILTLLADGKKLDQKHRDHALIGNYANHRECHIEPDWLLIYCISKDRIIFERTGSHSDLFR
ncbi:MAG TPA: type II toxin-antitoxin system YafQ family toxin [Dissulfurispiraceae bacterium]|nr:type II toxin-antitoxin system YafQ family toxin [Dissulfurispiraceae bacterium]